jgi:hypothetical protein
MAHATALDGNDPRPGNSELPCRRSPAVGAGSAHACPQHEHAALEPGKSVKTPRQPSHPTPEPALETRVMATSAERGAGISGGAGAYAGAPA